MKPGYKTTEFWLTLLATLMTALYASGAIPTKGTVAAIVAIAATALTKAGYAVGRSLVKAADAKSDATPSA